MSKQDCLAKSDSRFLMNWGERERERDRQTDREKYLNDNNIIL